MVFASAVGATDDLLLATLARQHGVEVLYAVSQTPQVMIDCQVSASADGLSITWDAPQGLFPDGVVDDMFAAYGALVERLADAAAAWSASPAVRRLAKSSPRRHQRDDGTAAIRIAAG